MSKFLFTSALIITCLFGESQNNYSKYLKEGITFIEQGNFKGAIEKLSKSLEYKDEIQNDYKIADIYLNRAFCRIQLGNNSDALSDANEAIKIKPEYTKSYLFKAVIYNDTRKYKEAIEACDAGLSYKENDENLLIQKAEALGRLKKYTNSNDALRVLLNAQPNSIKAIKYIGANFNGLKQWDSAIYYFSRAIELNPKDIMALYDRGISKSYIKDYNGARLDIEKAMQLDTITKDIGYNNLGFFLKLEQKEYEGAIEYFNKAIKLNPMAAYSLSNRGFAKLMLNDIKGAYKDIEKSLSIDKSNSYAYKNLALVYLKNNKRKDACICLNKSLELGYTETYDEEVNTLLKENCK